MGGCYYCGSWSHYAQYRGDCRAARQPNLPMKTTLETLRDDLKTVRGGKVAEGSVLRFDHGGSTYAAIFMGRKWYVTGNVLLGRDGPYTHSRMLNILAEASNIRLAAEWETI